MTKVYNININQTVPGEMGRVVGLFDFDGRTKRGQHGAFTFIPGADPEGDIYINFKVLSVRKGQKIRKEMKECGQKTQIISALSKFFESEQSQNGCDSPVQSESEQGQSLEDEYFEQEFGVETERKLALKDLDVEDKIVDKVQQAHARSNDIIGKALQNDPELRAYVNNAIDSAQGRVPVEAALGKHHDDLLELPEFLKRT